MVDVCLLTETYPPVTGGGETQARVLAKGFAAMGSAVTVITRRSDKAFARSEKLDDVSVYRVGPGGPGQIKKWGMVFTALVRLIRRRHAYDVILVCGYRVLGIPAIWAARLLGKPCILKADSLGEFSGAFFRAGLGRLGLRETNRLYRFLLARRNRMLDRASCFVAISSAVEDELIQQGVAPDRIVRIANSVDTEIFRPVGDETKSELRRQLGLPIEGRIGVFSGRLVSTKGLLTLVPAWAEIARAHANAHLVLVGSGGLGIQNCEPELRRLVASAGLADRITFTGSVANVHEYLQAADFFIFPTEREAFGIAVIEALACGLPVITTTTGGLADIVTAEETAIVVPVADEKALETSIRRVLQAGDDLRRMGEAGRATAIGRYAEPQVIAEYAALLQRAAAADA